MKMRLLNHSFLFISIVIFSFGSLSSQDKTAFNKRFAEYKKSEIIVNGYKVIKGARPEIDLTSIPYDSYEKGVIQVKFSPFVDLSSFEETIVASKSGLVKTGLVGVDELNKEFGVKEYRSLIQGLYSTNSKSDKFKDRHKAWGFHQWYQIELSSDADVILAVQKYSKLKEVEVAEPVYKIRRIIPIEEEIINTDSQSELKSSKWTPNDPYYKNNQWHFNNTGQDIAVPGIEGVDIKAESAWEIEKGNPKVIVGVIDGGIDFRHPDLAGNMWEGIGPEGNSTMPDSHGTHIGGTIAASTNNGIGLAGLAGGSGSNDGVRLMSLDLFDGRHGLSDLGLFMYSADNGAAISQNSWGYLVPTVFNQSALDGIDYFNANGGGEALLGGGIVIFAAGNDNSSDPWYPGFYPGTLAVASHDNRGERSSFSNYGTWVDITAPGTNIVSTDALDAGGEIPYRFMSGTSMACPHVSGVAALIISHYYGEITKAELWSALINGVDDIYAANPLYINQLGLGRSNAYKALMSVPRNLPKVVTGKPSFTSQTVSEIVGNVTNTGSSNVTARGVVWNISTNPTLENNIGATNNGSGLGSFTVELSGLTINLKYYARTYATNSSGTYYGNEVVVLVSNTEFKVISSAKQPIAGATININQETLTTNAQGIASITLEYGSYDYTITASGFQSTGGIFMVENESQTRNILLLTEGTQPIIAGLTNVCMESEVYYKSTNSSEGKWEAVGGVILIDNGNNALYRWKATTGSGIVRLRIINNEDYHSTYQLIVNINPNRTVAEVNRPVIYKKGYLPILICTTPNVTYQWMIDGNPLVGETKQFITARSESGNYQVQTIDSYQCPHTSIATLITIVPTSVTTSSNAYPNPNNGNFTLKYQSEETGEGVISIVNSFGKIMYQEKVIKDYDTLEKTLSLSHLPQGIYIVQVRIGNSLPTNSRINIYK